MLQLGHKASGSICLQTFCINLYGLRRHEIASHKSPSYPGYIRYCAPSWLNASTELEGLNLWVCDMVVPEIFWPPLLR